LKKHKAWDRRLVRKNKMGDTGPSSGVGGVKEGSLMWPMLSRSNYTEWAMLM